jgi:V8-like Glu-specific endopeptidase
MINNIIRCLTLSALVALTAACATPPAPEVSEKPKAPDRKPAKPSKEIVPHPSGAVDPVVRIDARDYPFSAVGRLNLGGSSFCTAALVSPDLILAPASCLYNKTEGRWWQPREMFFQAGYQFEKAAQQSGILSYAAPDGYRPGKRLTLASIRVDFSLLKLQRPIGNRAGWLGLAWNDDELEDDRLGRRAVIHHVGYTRDRQHVQINDAGCNVVDIACALAMPRPTLRPVAEQGGGFAALVVRTRAGIETREGLSRIMTGLLNKLGYNGPETPQPRVVGSKPTKTVALLLSHLGYFADTVANPSAQLIRRGIKAFQLDNGRAPDGEVSVQLLADMLRATQLRGRPAS